MTLFKSPRGAIKPQKQTIPDPLSAKPTCQNRRPTHAVSFIRDPKLKISLVPDESCPLLFVCVLTITLKSHLYIVKMSLIRDTACMCTLTDQLSSKLGLFGPKQTYGSRQTPKISALSLQCDATVSVASLHKTLPEWRRQRQLNMQIRPHANRIRANGRSVSA